MVENSVEWPRLLMYVGWAAGAIALFSSSSSAWLSDRELKGAKREIAELNDRAKAAEAQIANANRDAMQARLEQERLKATVAWRELSHETFSVLSNFVRMKPGRLHLGYTAGDPETMYYAARISHAFEQAGWAVSPTQMVHTNNKMFFETHIQDQSSADTTAFVRDAFRAAGLQFSTDPIDDVDMKIYGREGAVFLYIGVRRPVAFQ